MAEGLKQPTQGRRHLLASFRSSWLLLLPDGLSPVWCAVVLLISSADGGGRVAMKATAMMRKYLQREVIACQAPSVHDWAQPFLGLLLHRVPSLSARGDHGAN